MSYYNTAHNVANLESANSLMQEHALSVQNVLHNVNGVDLMGFAGSDPVSCANFIMTQAKWMGSNSKGFEGTIALYLRSEAEQLCLSQRITELFAKFNISVEISNDNTWRLRSQTEIDTAFIMQQFANANKIPGTEGRV